MIKTVFFDIGGVLLEIDPDRTARYWSEHSGVSLEVVKKSFPTEDYYRYERGFLSDHDFFRVVKQALTQPNNLRETDFWRGWSLLVGGETGATTVLTQLVKELPVWLLSNTNPRHIRNEVYHKYSFFQMVTGAIYSYQVGSRKPEPQIYLKALKITDSKPGESLLIDDTKANVEQARILGFRTVHFTSVADLKERLINLGLPVA